SERPPSGPGRRRPAATVRRDARRVYAWEAMFASPGAVALQVGPITIRWYGILMASAIGVGFWLAHREARRQKLPADDILRVGQWAVIAGLVGARLYEVIFNSDYYGHYPEKIVPLCEG